MNDLINSTSELASATMVFLNRKGLSGRVYCADGFNVSVQAMYGSYAEYDDEKGVLVSAELGFPSELDPIIAYHAEEKGTTETVFGYVPVELIAQLLINHGGVVRQG
jgi:hypothetical protein